jgi:thioesterase domain-containing protein
MAVVVSTGSIIDPSGGVWTYEVCVSMLDPTRLVWSLQSPSPGSSIRAEVAKPEETASQLIQKMLAVVARSAAN